MSNKNEVMINDSNLSTPDKIKEKNKKYKRKSTVLYITFFVLSIIFLVGFILFSIGLFNEWISFGYVLLLELITIVLFVAFLIPAVLFLVKYINFVRYTEKDRLKDWKSFDI